MEIVSVHGLQAMARARRHELGLRQEDLARRAGVSRKWLSEFERGLASAAELPMVLRLISALDLRMDVRPPDHPAAGAVDLDALLAGLTSPGEAPQP